MPKAYVRRNMITEDVPVPMPVDPHNRFAQAARTSWMLRDAKEMEIRDFFRSIPLSEALSQLASARKNIELAAEVINERIGQESENETCTSCGGPPKANGLWVMQGSEKDRDTGVNFSYRYCSMSCVRERNRRKMLPVGAPKHRLDGVEEGEVR